MTDVTPFDFEGTALRTVMIDGELWWVVADVCGVLEIQSATQAAERLESSDLCSTEVNSSSGVRRMLVCNESGLWDLVLDSRKPQARKFRRWVTTEVLPSIRKTGQYMPEPTTDLERSAVELLRHAQAIAQHDRRIAQLAEQMAGRDRDVTELTNWTAEHEARIVGIEGEYVEDRYEALGYAKLHNLPGDRAYLARLGKVAKRIGMTAGIEIVTARSPRYGAVYRWPSMVWAAAVREL